MVGVEDLGGCAAAHVVAVVAAPMVVAQQLVPRQTTLVVSRPLLECLETFSFADGAEGVQLREISNDGGRRLLAIVQRGSGSVVGFRRAQIVLWSAQGMDVASIVEAAAFTDVTPALVRFRLTGAYLDERGRSPGPP
jgi:hypothetical protein